MSFFPRGEGGGGSGEGGGVRVRVRFSENKYGSAKKARILLNI